jgi:predicted nucleic acid-binding protein
MLVWWASGVECVSAISRRERRRELAQAAVQRALDRLTSLETGWNEVQAVPAVESRARRLLRVHDLRAGDALQLAASLVAAEDQPGSLEFVSLDDRLNISAEREGLILV